MPFLGFHNIFFVPLRLCRTVTISRTLQVFLGGTSVCMTMLLAVDRYLHMNPDIQGSQSKIAKLSVTGLEL